MSLSVRASPVESEQLAYIDVESASNSHQASYGQVNLTSFNLLKVPDRDSRGIGNGFLRKTLERAKFTDAPSYTQ